ncbi:hypothetical protein J9303_05225, partial [Bacillaceae bacterium Marseille-Q3522]|nr:hypothetical protein [Bacillaceae bacterium Marseille-Q3522]
MGGIKVDVSRVKNLVSSSLFRVLLLLVMGAVLYAVMYNNVKPEKLELNLFSVAEQTVRSPVTIEDKASTDRKKQEALDQVQDVYLLKKEITQNRVDLTASIFDAAYEVNQEIKAELDEANDESKPAEGDNAATPLEEPSINEKVNRMKEKLTEDITDEISDNIFSALLQASNYDLNISKDLTVTAINNVMNSRIPADEVENAKKRVEEELSYTSLNSELKNAVIQLGRYAISQNEIYDPEATEEARQQAIDSVEPVKILQGQILVEENQLIDRDIYRQLGLVGLLDYNNSIQPFIGLFLLILIVLAVFFYYFQ